MKLYYVENEDSIICNWGCYWIVRANNAKEAIDKVFRDANWIYVNSDSPTRSDWRKASEYTGIKKCKLWAKPLDEIMDNSSGVYRIK